MRIWSYVIFFKKYGLPADEFWIITSSTSVSNASNLNDCLIIALTLPPTRIFIEQIFTCQNRHELEIVSSNRSVRRFYWDTRFLDLTLINLAFCDNSINSLWKTLDSTFFDYHFMSSFPCIAPWLFNLYTCTRYKTIFALLLR